MTIRCENISKRYRVVQKEAGIKNALKSLVKPFYKDVDAVKNINFSIKQGEKVGVIGMNGAGKTTTLKMLTGLIKPSEGEIRVLGYEPFKRKKEFLQDISFLMGNKSQLWWDVPALDSFYIEGAIYNVKKADLDKRIEELVKLLGVQDLLHTPVRKLSLGERMKMELILVMLHQPKILFLDEPTLGLDVLSQNKIRTFLEMYNQREEATIIMTSHNMRDIETLCERVIIINDGMILYDDSLVNLKRDYKNQSLDNIVLGLFEGREDNEVVR